MSWGLLSVYAGLVAASVTATVYGVWAARWMRRRAYLLAVMNAIIAIVGVVLVLAHLLSLSTPAWTEIRLRRVPLWLLYTDGIFLLPAVTRLAELRRDRRRDEVREEIAHVIAAQTSAIRNGIEGRSR